MSTELLNFDVSLQRAIYGFIVRNARAPLPHEMAAELSASDAQILAGYQRLYAKRLLVLNPDGQSIRMAPPFSGIPTPHRVHVDGTTYFANCAWDSFGIPAALHREARVESRCAQTGEPLTLRCGLDGPVPVQGWVFHIAVPAAHWWRDIVYT